MDAEHVRVPHPSAGKHPRRRLEPVDRGCQVAAGEGVEPKRSPGSDLVPAVATLLADLQCVRAVRESLASPERRLDEGKPGKRPGERHLVAQGLRQLQRLKRRRVRCR